MKNFDFKIQLLFLLSGLMLISGTIIPSLNLLFYLGFFMMSCLILKECFNLASMYFFAAPYFAILGFGVWNYVFPYYSGIILALLLGELSGRVLYITLKRYQKFKWNFVILPALFFVFDFFFQKVPFIRLMNMPPILAPLYKNRIIISLSAIFGAQLSLFIVLLAISSVAGILVSWKFRRPKAVIASFCISFIVASLIFFLLQPHWELENKNMLKVAVVQGNYPGNKEVNSFDEEVDDVLKYYLSLADKVESDIIVFPEKTFGVYDSSNIIDEIHREKLSQASRTLGGTSVFTVLEGNSLTKDKKGRYISALVITEGEIEGITRKRNLVPFSETKNYSRGIDHDVFDLPKAKVGISICYDINEETVENLKENGAEIILAPFNNNSFGNVYHNISAYHPVIKAAQCTIPIAVANEDGISQIIESTGIVIKEIPFKEKGVIQCEIDISKRHSLYMLIGRYLEWVMFAFLTIFILLGNKIFRSRVSYSKFIE